MGSLLNQNLCDRGKLTGDRFAPAVLAGYLPIAAAVQIIRIKEGGVDDVRNNIASWRQSPEEHLPNIAWAVDESGGWGYSRSLIFKVVDCDDIPEVFGSGTKDKNADFLLDDGKHSLDEAMYKLAGTGESVPHRATREERGINRVRRSEE